MATDAELKALPPEEKLRIVEMLWSDLADSGQAFPVPARAEEEAIRRRDEMRRDPSIGLTEDEVWRRIDGHAG